MAIGSELWVEGNQGEACIMVDDYEYKVVAWASAKLITASELKTALEEEYPDITFDTMTDVSPRSIYAVGKRVL
jgi:hypothetical protein